MEVKLIVVLIYVHILLLLTFSPGIIPLAASKQAPEIRPCSRNSGRGASPSFPSGSEPITLKYLNYLIQDCKKLEINELPFLEYDTPGKEFKLCALFGQN